MIFKHRNKCDLGTESYSKTGVLKNVFNSSSIGEEIA